MNQRHRFAFLCVALCGALCFGQVAFCETPSPIERVEPLSLMPIQSDHGTIWWGEGFPSHAVGLPWHRCIQTGNYGLVLNTKTMQLPHFGPMTNGDLFELPPARLDMRIIVDGKSYVCTAGGPWTQKTGPRLIESGRFFQRADVTNLVFESSDGHTLNADARMETAAWPDRLGLILSARPGRREIQAGEKSFGRFGGGYGLDGSNELEIPHEDELDTETFTLSLWAFVPEDYRASTKAFPWLVCKNRNEAQAGNYGLVIVNGHLEARINIGGTGKNSFVARTKQRLKTGQWTHLAMTYDGAELRLYIDGRLAAMQAVNLDRVPGTDSLIFGRRADDFGDGYHFRGVIDEISYFDRSLGADELAQTFRSPRTHRDKLKPVRHWSFMADGRSSMEAPREQWKSADLAVAVQSGNAVLKNATKIPTKESVVEPIWYKVAVAIDPTEFCEARLSKDIEVTASETLSGVPRPITYDHDIGWHRINLDGIDPIIPAHKQDEAARDDSIRNDSMERVQLKLSNKSQREQVARLMFEKKRSGIRQRIGSPITGISAILRDTDGNPTGIPVQLSKNWHSDGTDDAYARQWFHGISQVRLPPQSDVELELSIVYGNWGGVAAASSSQLSLIGWGSNQLWNQAAIGSWGESICFEPDQVQANCTITDVRPLMLKSKPEGNLWNWTSNVGGGDFFRMFDRDGKRIPHTGMKTTFHRYGPCLTEVTNTGRLGDAIEHTETISLARTDDITRVTYRLQMQAGQPVEFSRLAFFQVGADTYNHSLERKMAIGNLSGLTKQWNTTWGGNRYQTEPIKCTGIAPWASLHEGTARPNQKVSAWANRGVVIRSWKARLGGNETSPWIAEHGVDYRGVKSSTLDIVPPPNLTRLKRGDFIDATIEHLVVPQEASDYYGPNVALSLALQNSANTWRMIHREAMGTRDVALETGKLEHSFPDIRIHTFEEKAKFIIENGIGYVPFTFTGLTSPTGYTLRVDGVPLDQGVHGNDFWQTDYDPETKLWSRTYNVPLNIDGRLTIEFQPM